MVSAPAPFNHRHFRDVPWSDRLAGERYGVSVRGIESIIRLACIVHRTDYWRRGRTVDKLGISDLSVSELTRYVNEGIRD
jgi:opine dehydrogenase